MTENKAPIEVRHNPGEHRFEAVVEGHTCVADYAMRSGEIVFTHTYVSSELRGRGIAEKLVRTALEYARRENLRVVPDCSYVAAFIQRHPEYVQLTN